MFSTLRVVKGEFQRTARRVDDEYGVIVDWAVMAVDVNSGRPRRLTPWRRNQVLTPTSFSSDGSKLAAELLTLKRGAAVFKGTAAVTVELGGGPTKVLARDADEPIYSPDGSRVAFVRTRHAAPSEPEGNRPPGRSDLFVMPAAGGRPVKLTSVKGGLAWPVGPDRDCPLGKSGITTTGTEADVDEQRLDAQQRIADTGGKALCLRVAVGVEHVHDDQSRSRDLIPMPVMPATPVACRAISCSFYPNAQKRSVSLSPRGETRRGRQISKRRRKWPKTMGPASRTTSGTKGCARKGMSKQRAAGREGGKKSGKSS